MQRNFVTSSRRYIPGQNDDRDRAVEFLSQLRSDLDPAHPMLQIEVCKNEVRLECTIGDQFQRRDAVWYGGGAMPLVFQKSGEKLALFGIVLND